MNPQPYSLYTFWEEEVPFESQLIGSDIGSSCGLMGKCVAAG